MKLKKFFAERLKGKTSSQRQPLTVSLQVNEPAIATARGTDLKSRVPECDRLSTAPAKCQFALNVSDLRGGYGDVRPPKVTTRDNAECADRFRYCADWIRENCSPALRNQSSESRRRMCCSTIVEASEPEGESEFDQYYTVPRYRSRIKTNPWIPTPRSISCHEDMCSTRRMSDSGTGASISAGGSDCRLAPSEEQDIPKTTPRQACNRAMGLFCERSMMCKSLNDADYYEWHDTLREAYTPVTRGDSISSAEDCMTRCSNPDTMYEPADATANAGRCLCFCPGPGLVVADVLRVSELPIPDDRLPPEECYDDSRVVPLECETLSDKVRRLRQHRDVLNEKIRLARVECQLILSGELLSHETEFRHFVSGED